MKNRLLMTLFGLLSPFLHAQDLDDFRLTGGAFISPKEYVNYQKLPFFKNEFLKGRLTTARGLIVNPISLRFDLFANELQYIHEKKVYLVSEPINEFVLIEPNVDLNQEYIFRRYVLDESKSKPVFCEILYDGNIKLVKYVKKNEVTITTMTESTTQKTFSDYVVLYYQQGNSLLIRLEKKGKNLLSLLPNDKQQQVQEYIKASKIKLNNEGDLSKLFAFIDTLK